MRSIRRHLSHWLLAGMAVMILVCGIGCYDLVRRTLRQRFDDALVDKARAFTTLVEPELAGVEFPLEDTLARMPEFTREEHPEYFELWLGDGVSLHRSPSLRATHLPMRFATMTAPELWDLELSDGRNGRAVGIRFEVRERVPTEVDPAVLDVLRTETGIDSGGIVTLVMARGSEDVDRILATLLLALGVAGGSLLIGTALWVRRVVRTGCRPVLELAQRIETLDVESETPLDTGAEVPAELRAFHRRFQQYRERIASSFAREKRLTSNIAHELRTPIAELRTITELALSWPGDLDLQQKSMAESHAIALQMERLLRTCLRLARLQSGQAPLESEALEVSSLLQRLSRRSLDVLEEKEIRFEAELEPDCICQTDPELLELVLSNLLDNAFQHAPRGTWVHVLARREERGLRIAIANPAEDLAPDELPRLEEPFWHKSSSASHDDHLGLGLAMVRAASRMLGAQFQANLSDGRFETSLHLVNDEQGATG